MRTKRFRLKMLVYLITWSCLFTGLFCISTAEASQRCFKCCGSGVWHTDNKIPCNGKSCSYCIKCNGCGGSGQISDSAKRCEDCRGLGQIHNSKKACTGAGCSYCTPCKACNSKGWIGG